MLANEKDAVFAGLLAQHHRKEPARLDLAGLRQGIEEALPCQLTFREVVLESLYDMHRGAGRQKAVCRGAGAEPFADDVWANVHGTVRDLAKYKRILPRCGRLVTQAQNFV